MYVHNMYTCTCIFTSTSLISECNDWSIYILYMYMYIHVHVHVHKSVSFCILYGLCGFVCVYKGIHVHVHVYCIYSIHV